MSPTKPASEDNRGSERNQKQYFDPSYLSHPVGRYHLNHLPAHRHRRRHLVHTHLAQEGYNTSHSPPCKTHTHKHSHTHYQFNRLHRLNRRNQFNRPRPGRVSTGHTNDGAAVHDGPSRSPLYHHVVDAPSSRASFVAQRGSIYLLLAKSLQGL
jgi:hypothetical protein